jgi:hypothetical protein
MITRHRSRPYNVDGIDSDPGQRADLLSWNATPGATGYNVKRATTSGGPYASVTNGVTSTTYTNYRLGERDDVLLRGLDPQRRLRERQLGRS